MNIGRVYSNPLQWNKENMAEYWSQTILRFES